MTDEINIKDVYVINISVKFNIIVKRGYNKNDVLFQSIQKVKEFFEHLKIQLLTFLQTYLRLNYFSYQKYSHQFQEKRKNRFGIYFLRKFRILLQLEKI